MYEIHSFSLYEQKVWHYQKANADHIKRALSEFPKDNRFEMWKWD